MVHIGFIYPNKRIKPFSHFTKYCMLPIKIVEIITQGNVELRSIKILSSASHGNRTSFRMLQVQLNLITKKTSLISIQEFVNGIATCPCTCWITCLCSKILLNSVKERAIIVFDPAPKLDKINPPSSTQRTKNSSAFHIPQLAEIKSVQ